MKALLFSAGLGTRLRPITNDIPKALVPVNGKTLLQRNIEYLTSQGIDEIVINVHHFHQKIIDYLDENQNFGTKIIISDESAEVLETGGGLKKAEPYLNDADFVVMNVDILTNLNLVKMIENHLDNDRAATLAVTTRASTRVLLFDEGLQLCGWKNIKTNETKISREKEKYYPMAFSGIHVVSPEIFQYLPSTKHSIIQSYLELAKDHPIIGYDHSEDIFVDVGKHDTLAKAIQLFE